MNSELFPFSFLSKEPMNASKIFKDFACTGVLILILTLFSTTDFSAQKINGISLVGHPVEIEGESLETIQQVNANWVALMPYAFTSKGSDQLRFDTEGQWWGEKLEGVEACIQMAQQHQLRVMIKPHVWIGHGEFTGSFELPTEEAWSNWEAGYEKYILQYAELSETYNLPVLCIGTELDESAQTRKSFWDKLISKIREVYSGKLVYAANWDTYQKIPFWDKLDYVGVDAYFPLSSKETPQIKSLMRAWHPIMKELQEFSYTNKKAVMFTEFGYRSVNFTAEQPWRSDRDLSLNFVAQSNALEALFKMFWAQEWFAGGFLWKWHAEDEKINGDENNRFTPQNKPAEKVVAQWYAKFYH